MNFILLAQPVDALNNYPSPVYQVLNFNQSAFLEGILPILQNHSWNNGTKGGCQLGGGDTGLLSLPLWPTNVAQAIVWASFLLQSALTKGFAPFHHIPTLLSIPPNPAVHPIHPVCKLS